VYPVWISDTVSLIDFSVLATVFPTSSAVPEQALKQTQNNNTTTSSLSKSMISDFRTKQLGYEFRKRYSCGSPPLPALVRLQLLKLILDFLKLNFSFG
jgi:hypothetical protein